jgi:hypothetical protein
LKARKDKIILMKINRPKEPVKELTKELEVEK